ncbi:hypothetical protein WDU94_012081, partial [Cyamophila willieti]
DVFEKADDTVSELLAQKISEELNKKCTSQIGSKSNIHDLAHQVVENTASDGVFDDLCAEMYEEGFLADLVQSQKPRQRISARKSGSPHKSFPTPSRSKQLNTSLHTPEDLPSSQPLDFNCSFPKEDTESVCSMQHSPSELTVKSSPLSQFTTDPPDSHMLDPGDPHTPMSQSTLDPRHSHIPIGCSTLDPQKEQCSPPTSPIPPSNSTMVEVNTEGSPKTYHVMRSMSVSSDVSSVMSGSSLNTSVSAYGASSHSHGQGSTVSAISVCTTGTSSQGSVTLVNNRTILPSPSPSLQSHLSPGKGQFTLPTNTGLLTPVSNCLGQPVLGTQLLLLPMTSPSATLLHSPTLTPLSTVQTSHQIITPGLTPGTGGQFKRYVKIKPKPCKSKDPKKNIDHPIIVQVANQNNPIIIETNEKSKHIVNTTHESTYGSNAGNAKCVSNETNTVVIKYTSSETNPKTSPVSGSNCHVECSPYKLDTFVSFNNSSSSCTQSQSKKNQCSDNVGPSSSDGTTDLTVGNNNEPLETPFKDNVNNDDHCNQPRETETMLEVNDETNEDLDKSRNDEEKDSTEVNISSAESSLNTEPRTKLDRVNIDQINPTGDEIKEDACANEQNMTNISSCQASETKTNHVNPNEQYASNETIHVSEPNEPNTSIENQTEFVDQRSEQMKDLLPSKSFLDDSVKFIINEEPLDSVVVYESCSDNTLSDEAAVIVIPPPEETVGEEPTEENHTNDIEILTEQNPGTDQNSGVAVVEVLEEKDCQGRKSDFYLVTEPKHVYVVVNHHPSSVNEAKEKASSKTTQPKVKPNTGKKPSKVLEKSSPEKAKLSKSNKQSPSLLKETLDKVSENKKPSATKVHNFSLDFLNCKVTPAVKVLSTPKRKSSSTPRRSHVRALKFETPLKPTVTKRKCNTSPKECKNQTPIIFERKEKPKNVSRNLCEDVEMKKNVEPVKQKQPWDVGLRKLIVTHNPSHEIEKVRKRNEKKKSQVRSHQSKKKKNSSMKTIPEELNNSDNAKCSMDATLKQCKVKAKKQEEHVAPAECDPVSNEGEGSILSLNVEDTPLKIADFQDDIHDSLKTPSKGLLFPSRNLTFTPIDNIIRNNIGESESLLKIIEDINMFKETPIKEALENLSDKSNTPSPCKTSLTNPETQIQDNRKQEEIPNIIKSGKKKNTKKSEALNKSASKRCKKNGTKKSDDLCKPIESCNSSFETESTTSQRTNRKQTLKPIDKQQPLRRSLRTNSAINKENFKDPNDKDSMVSISDDEHVFKGRRKKKSSKAKSEEVPQETNTLIREDIETPTSSKCNEFKPNTSRLSDNSSIGENNYQLPNQSTTQNLQTHCKSISQESSTSENCQLTNENLRISTFLDDCVLENQKALQNAKDKSRKRLNRKNIENDGVASRKRKGNPDEEVENPKKSKRRKKSPTKLKIDSKSMKQSSNKEIPSMTEEINTLTILSTLASNRSKLDVCNMDETSLDNVMKTNQIPLNLSATSSDKENSSTMDVEVTNNFVDDNNTMTIIAETASPSQNIIVNSILDSKDIRSSCNNTVNTSLENNQEENINNKSSIVTVIDEVDNTPSDDDEDEDNKVFICISHEDNTHMNNARNHTHQSDRARNFEVELVVGEDTKKLVSSELYNILDYKP